MEKFNYTLSLKNIPIPPNDYYMKKLMAKTEEFIQRLRWKAFFFLNPNDDATPKPTYGFKTAKTAPQTKDLHDFESDLYDVVNNIQFTNFRSQFQRKLNNDVRAISKNNNLYLIADKTRNIYEVSKDTYNKLLHDNVTSTYVKTPRSAIDDVNTEARNIATSLGIDDRVEQLAEKTAFITLKDHKENFQNRPKCRLINPAKSQIGRLSKQIIDPINNAIKAHLNLNQWKSTQQVLDWFNQIEEKSCKRFLQFDIREFYPSITEELLLNALEFAHSIEPAKPLITKENRDIILHCRKSFLFTHASEPGQNATPWTKKSGLFDVTMGAYDGAEICELVGLYILNLVKDRFPELDLGLYRDDGLAIHRRLPGPEIDRTRKNLIDLFKGIGLDIDIQIDMQSVNFLDVSLDLPNGRYGPYRKPNDRPLYVHRESSHPPTVLKQIPLSINKRLCSIASTKAEFDREKPAYQEALTASGYKHQLTYTKPGSQTTKRKCKRKIIWFNPPYSRGVKTNLGQKFLALVKKHFAPGTTLYSILNKNTVKLSYSCTRNMQSIIKSHNQRLLSSGPDSNEKSCNCRVKDQCPVQGKCLKPVVYKATIVADGVEKSYVGSTNNFKSRFSAHKNSFKNSSYQNATALSTFVWKNKLNPNPQIKWEILRVVPPYEPGQTSCQLCLEEKVQISNLSQDSNNLNKRSEIAQACRHRARFKLRRL